MNIKVCILTSAHDAFDTRIFHKEARTLAQAGYDVVVVVPGGGAETAESVCFRRVPLPKGRFERMMKTTWNVWRAAVREHADAYHFHDPELIPAGLLLKAQGKKVIYDVHEDLPRQIMSKPWIPGGLRPLLGWLAELVERLGSATFDAVVAATPVIGARFPASKTVVAQNFPRFEEASSHAEAPYCEREPLLAYTGSTSRIRGALEMLGALEQVPEGLGVRLLLAGSFSPEEFEKELQAQPGWAKVDFLGWQSRRGVYDMMGRCRAGLVLFHPEPNHIEAQPNKLFEYMSAGLPVIASNFPLWREIVAGAGCGLLVNPLDPRAIAGAIEWLLAYPQEAEEMGRRGKAAVRSTFNWQRESERLLALYRRILGQRGDVAE